MRNLLPRAALLALFSCIGLSQIQAQSKSRHSPDGRSNCGTSVSCTNVPLAMALARVGELNGLNILFDKAALEKNDIDPQTPVSCIAGNVTVDAALKELLAPLKLVHSRQGKTVVVSTQAVDLTKFDQQPVARRDGKIEPYPGFVSVKPYAMQSALNRKVLFSLPEVPFRVSLRLLEVALGGQRIRLDRAAIRKAGISLTGIVQLPLSHRTAREHLTKLVEQVGLTFETDENGILITVPRTATLARK